MCEKYQNNNEKGNLGPVAEFIKENGRLPMSPNELVQFIINKNIAKISGAGCNCNKTQDDTASERINAFTNIPTIMKIIGRAEKDRFDKAVEFATEEIQVALGNLIRNYGDDVVEEALGKLGFLIPVEDESPDDVIISLIERINELEGKLDGLGNIIQGGIVTGEPMLAELKEFDPTKSIRKIVRQEVKKEVNRRYGQIADKK